MKIKHTIPLCVVVFFVFLRYFASWCIDSSGICYGSWLHHIFPYFIKPAYLYALAILPLAISLLFVSSAIFKSWLKFAVRWIPLSVLIIALAPVTSNSWMSLYEFVKEDATWMMGSLFVMVSVGIIFGKLLAVFLDKYSSSFNGVLKAWLKFVYFWVPFSLAFIFLPVGLGYFLDGYFFNFFAFPISLEHRVWLMGGLFLLISFFVAVLKALTLKNKS